MKRSGGCAVEGCREPRHVTASGGTRPLLCTPHDRVFNALQYELERATKTTKGTWDLFFRIEAEPDRALAIVEDEWRRLTGSADEADIVMDHLDHARRGKRFRSRERRS